MSETLRKRLRTTLASKKLLTLFSRFNSLKFIGFADDSDHLISPDTACKDMILIDAVPTSTIDINAAHVDLSKWLINCLGKARIGDKFYLIIADYGELPWAKVETTSSDWLIELWGLLEIHSLFLLSPNQTTVLGLFEEEHYYEAYIQEIQAKF